MKIESTQVWDNLFFERFINFKNKLFADNADIYNESLNDLEKIFQNNSPVTKDYKWYAFIVSKDGSDLARGVFSFKSGSTIGQIGFIESTNNQDAFFFLLNEITQKAKSEGIKELRGPTDINFFVKYRWKLPNGGLPFYSEPLVPDYYHQFIKAAGFFVSETWDTFSLDYKLSLKRWKEKRKKISKKKESNYQHLELRSIRPWLFDKEIETIHKLFVASYKNMSEYAELDLASFKILYNDFKYIINPLFSYIAYYENEPVGFCLNFFDPHPLLKKFSKQSPSPIEKLKLLAQLQLNQKRLLIMYSGKVQTSKGEEIKGLQLKVSTRLSVLMIFLRIKDVYVCFQSQSSPSKRTFDDDAQKPYSQYVMYKKSL